jgi:D-xylose 1-dehydrogenase (NADP+, D-xylono-1,5-lactone-forming)
VTLAWGVIGATSGVATQAVLPALRASSSARLAAVASRDGAAANAVAAAFGAARAYGRYDDVLADEGVEAVYVPLPNSLHREWVVRAAEAGKHVLCEKPLACTGPEAQAMADACAAAGVHLMEAYMTPFHPRSEALTRLLATGALGDVRFARAAFTFPLHDAGNHRWRQEMGGGALLDLGVYCVSPLLTAGGDPPERLAARAVASPSGVDASFSGWLEFPSGMAASFCASFEAPERQHLELVGTAATALVDAPFAGGTDGTVVHLLHCDGRQEDVDAPSRDPYLGMVEHFAAVVTGEAQSRRPPPDSVALLGLLDALRAAAS